jgi:hypothetical protein
MNGQFYHPRIRDVRTGPQSPDFTKMEVHGKSATVPLKALLFRNDRITAWLIDTVTTRYRYNLMVLQH